MQHIIIQQGLDLMLYGMGTVFVFLCCLIAVTRIMSRAAQRWPDDILEDASTPIPVDKKTASVIKKAIMQHRKKLNIPS